MERICGTRGITRTPRLGPVPGETDTRGLVTQIVANAYDPQPPTTVRGVDLDPRDPNVQKPTCGGLSTSFPVQASRRISTANRVGGDIPAYSLTHPTSTHEDTQPPWSPPFSPLGHVAPWNLPKQSGRCVPPSKEDDEDAAASPGVVRLPSPALSPSRGGMHGSTARMHPWRRGSPCR